MKPKIHDYIKSYSRIFVIALADVALYFICNMSICFVTMNGDVNDNFYSATIYNWIHILVTCVIMLSINHALGLYRNVWTFADVGEIARSFVSAVFNAIGLFVVDYVLFHRILGKSGILPYYAYIVFGILILITNTIPRLGYRMARQAFKNITSRDKNKRHKRIMIVGVGFMGNFIIDDLRHGEYKTGYPIIAVDDDPLKYKKRINSVKIVGVCNDIPKLAKEYNIDQIIICVPSAPDKRKKEIIDLAMQTDAQVKISPSMQEFLENGKTTQSVRNVDISDLLSRPEINLDKGICNYLIGKTILVTGGGGSIGSEICMQVARYTPKQIVIFDIYENCAYELQTELIKKYSKDIKIDVRIGSVRDINRLREIFSEFKPDVVFHAAAHKHVPLMEDSPCEAVKNNVFGTYNVARVADEYAVKKMVILSTDKAVNPTNVMGATKRLTEIIVQHMNEMSNNTCYAAVRFGNVLGSHGSVIPLFKRQIEEGGPVCVTHPDITRYFMTIPEAAQLVCQAGGLAKGGEIFVLDMGEPVKIIDLAKNLIRLSGYTEEEIPIVITGLRPGEKLFEELAMEDELKTRKKTQNKKIYVTQPIQHDVEEFEKVIVSLRSVNAENVRTKLMKAVPNYHPAENE